MLLLRYNTYYRVVLLSSNEYCCGVLHNFGNELARRRVDRGLSYRGLADLIAERTGVKVDHTGLKRMESGAREPRLDEALAIAEVLDSTVEAMADVRLAPVEEIVREVNSLRNQIDESAIGMSMTVDAIGEASVFLYQIVERAVRRGDGLSKSEIWCLAWLLKVEEAWRQGRSFVQQVADLAGLTGDAGRIRFEQQMSQIAKWRRDFPEAQELEFSPAAKLAARVPMVDLGDDSAT